MGDKYLRQLPFRVETGERRQADQHGDEAREGQNEDRTAAQHGPVAKRAAGHEGREPEEPRLGRRMGQKDTARDEGCGLAQNVALPDHGQHEAELTDRGIAEQAAVIRLTQRQQPRAEEAQQAQPREQRRPGRPRDHGDLGEREDGRRAGASREERGETGMGGLVNIERPAVRREGFELDHQSDQQEEHRQPRPRDARRRSRDMVKPERAVRVIGEDDPDQQQDRDDLADHQIFEPGGERARIGRQEHKARRRNRDQLEEDEQVEDVARQDEPRKRHHQHQQHRHRPAPEPQQGPAQRERPEPTGHKDRRHQHRLGQANAQADRKGRRRRGGGDQDGRRTACHHGKPAERHQKHGAERAEHEGKGQIPPPTRDKTEAKGAAEAERQDPERAYHFSSVKSEISRLPRARNSRQA